MCHWGRRCRGLRGLKVHQRGCRTLQTLLDVDPMVDRIAYNFIAAGPGMMPADSTPVALCFGRLDRVAGLRLPRSRADWAVAHVYFSAYVMPTQYGLHDASIAGRLCP